MKVGLKSLRNILICFGKYATSVKESLFDSSRGTHGARLHTFIVYMKLLVMISLLLISFFFLAGIKMLRTEYLELSVCILAAADYLSLTILSSRTNCCAATMLFLELGQW